MLIRINVIDREDAIYDKETGSYVVPLKVVGDTLVPKTEAEIKADQETSVVQVKDLPSSPTSTKLADARNELDDNGTDVTPQDTRPEYYYYRYTRSSTATISRASKKVSANISCEESGGCTVSKNVSSTSSASYSANVTNDAMKSAIKANAGFTWHNSATNSTTYTFNIGKGDRGHIRFTPLYKRTVGTLKKYSNIHGLQSSKAVTGYSVKKTADGEADGDYYFSYN